MAWKGDWDMRPWQLLLGRFDRDRDPLIGTDAAARQFRRDFAGSALDEFRSGAFGHGAIL